jgi:hypothetical protein
LLVVATVIATILVAGCSLPTQTSPQVASSSSNTSSTNASTAKSSSSAVKTASSVKPSLSASATPTAVPPGSGKIATSISGGPTFLSQTQSPIAQGTKVSWAFEVIAQGHILCGNGATVTVLIDGKSVGQVHPQSPVGGSCFATANFDWTATSGSHTLTVTYAGNDMYQSSELPPVHLVVTS